MKLSRNGRSSACVALTFAGLAATTPWTMAAQGIDPRCPGVALQDRATQDACQKAVDIFAFMTPQLGIGLVGGSATLGTGGALGGLGHFSIGVRGNGIRGRVPQVENMDAAITGAVRSDYDVNDQVVGLPTVEGALGVFGGVPMGVTHAFALDALVSATYVPEFTRSKVALSVPGGSLKLGFGGRLGLLTESVATPSVSVTYLRRDLPTTGISGRPRAYFLPSSSTRGSCGCTSSLTRSSRCRLRSPSPRVHGGGCGSIRVRPRKNACS